MKKKEKKKIIKKHIALCSICSITLDEEDIDCCESLALGKMFCKDCMFNKVSKLAGGSTADLEQYLLLDDEVFKMKMDSIKKELLKEFRKEGKFERY
jgi:hypothetical protein